ncbi:MAG TPA: hypothetical protein VFU31_19380 [Candidatus Binatia bacterium]|nr:hypothetical protein [Candidatus Binatia bacterium]
MKVIIVSSKDMAPSRDNPAGRWDVGFHSLKVHAIRFANNLAAAPGKVDAEMVLATVANDRARLELRRKLDNAGSVEEVYQVLLSAMRLTDPREDLAAGLQHLARRIAAENALRLTREAMELLTRAKTIKASIHLTEVAKQQHGD